MIAAAQEIIPQLLKADGVVIDQLLTGKELAGLLGEVAALSASDTSVKDLLKKAFADSQAYHQAWIAKSSSKKK